MSQKNRLCLFFLILLWSPLYTMASRKKREVRQVTIPPVYIGAIVSPTVYFALLAKYGEDELIRYRVKNVSSDSHSCANNRGWCRRSCFVNEYLDWYNSAVCGRHFYCCQS